MLASVHSLDRHGSIVIINLNLSIMISIVVYLSFLLVQVSMEYSIEPRIINGETPRSSQFQFMASIQLLQTNGLTYVHVCGGSVIEKLWILSSAVCVKSTVGIESARVKVNMFYTSNNDDKIEIIPIAERIIHENFNGSSNIRPNDIALIKLARGIVNHVAIKLAEPRFHPFNIVFLIGWGAISAGSSPQYPDVLQYSCAVIMDDNLCTILVNKSRSLLDSQMCTYTPGRASTAGIGDGGGPVIRYVDGEMELKGIMSWTLIPRGQVGSPTVSTRVSQFIPWIIDKISKKPNKMSDGDDLLTPLLIS